MIGRRASLLALRRRRPLSDLRSITTLPQLQNPRSYSMATDPCLLGFHRLIGNRIGVFEGGDGGARSCGFGVRGYATRMAESSNRPPKETILLDGCDLEHWLVVVEKPGDELTRDEIIDGYIKTFAQVVGSEEEARMKIYSVSTKHYYAFGALISEELSLKLKELPNVRWVLPDSYFDVPNKTYAGEPFINGVAVPYDPKYHEVWVRNHAASLRNNEKNRLKRQGNTRTTNRTPPSSPPYSAGDHSQSGGNWNSDRTPPASSQNQTPQPSQVPNQLPPPQSHTQALPPQSHTQAPANNYPNQAPQFSQMQEQRFVQPPLAPQPSYGPTRAGERKMPPSGYQSQPSNASQFQNHAGPLGTSLPPTQSADRFTASTVTSNQAVEPSYMPNQLPPNQSYAAPSRGGPTWNRQNQNWMPHPDYQNDGQQAPTSNSNPSGWNSPTSGTYSPSQDEQRSHGISYGMGNQNQHMQPPAPQMSFQSQTRNPPFPGVPPLQQQNHLPPGNTFPTAQNSTFQNSYQPQSAPNDGYWSPPPQSPQQHYQNDFRFGNMPQTSQNYSYPKSYPSQPGQNHGYQSHDTNPGGNRDLPRSNTFPSSPHWNERSRVQTHDMQNNGVPHYVQSTDREGNAVNLQSRDSIANEQNGDADQTNKRWASSR